MRFMVSLMIWTASLSDRPGAMLNEMVLATKRPWWLTASGVVPGPKWVNALSGTIVSVRVLTAAPVELEPRPVAESWLLRWLRSASAALVAAVAAVLWPAALVVGAGAVAVAAIAFVACAPLTLPPDVLTKISFSISGLCQYCGATSITTWYWFNGLKMVETWRWPKAS